MVRGVIDSASSIALNAGGLVGLVVALLVAYGVVMGAVVLVTGWHLFRNTRPLRFRRGVVVPPVGVTGHHGDGDVR